MSTDRELILQQALDAVAGAAVEMGLPFDFVVAAAMQGLVDGARYLRVDREHLSSVFLAMTQAHDSHASVHPTLNVKARSA
ncbi:hypothetical protein [Pseudomonas eucalypticola]|uniref:Uncharacterized protein n=1 Tax=Pseudomonas eucalypticola TaxID=2599595 RepID=A0A7D5HZ56_9PSED|nr:hypothetical protein [Pseudomonas eucalypticola]QKZ06171.1 hypothetical protein HWQ56_21285 [Pseudomonas eucalypticola]